MLKTNATRDTLLKLLFNDLSQVQRADVAFMFTQRVALFDQSGIFNYGDLYATRDTPIEATV